MERRKFMLGIGSLAAGGAAAMGTGAFGAVQANRDARVEVVGDSSAYLQITEIGSTPVVDTKDNGEIAFNFGADNGRGGSGMNLDGHTEFTEIVRAKNTSKHTVLFAVDTAELRDLDAFDDVNVFAHDDNGSPEYDSAPGNPRSNYPPTIEPTENNEPIIDLDPGESVDLSFHFNTNSQVDTGTETTVFFIAVEEGGQYDNSS